MPIPYALPSQNAAAQNAFSCPEQPPAHVQSLARRVARAAGTFEYEHFGREPSRVTVVTGRTWMVVSLQASLPPLERIAARFCAASAAEIERRQRVAMAGAVDALRDHVRMLTGVELVGAMVSVDAATGSVLETFTTASAVDLFLLGEGMPALGVPIDAHVHADGPHAPEAVGSHAGGTNHLVRREPFAMPHL